MNNIRRTWMSLSPMVFLALLNCKGETAGGSGGSGGDGGRGGAPAAGDTGNTGSPGQGGTPTGGSKSGGTNTTGSNTGGSNTGGSNTGGSNTGGSNTGGSNTGGSNTGGSNTGGSKTGGSNTGGSKTGGSNTGGSNTGGSNTGGTNTGGTNTGGANTGGANTGGNAGGLSGARSRARVFLSGHSLLDSPIDEFVADIASRKGDNYNYNLQNIVGSPIRIRTRNNGTSDNDWSGYSLGKNRNGQGMNVIAELANPATLGANEDYDTLVITERNDLILTLQWESTTSLLRHYHDRLRTGNPNGITMLYHAWQALNKDNPTAWIAFEKSISPVWECAAAKVNLTLQSNNLPQNVLNIPASRALVELVERAIAGNVPGITGSTRAKLDVIFADDVHLSRLGAYFAASVIYSAVFRKTPEGAQIPSGLPQNTAQYMQTLAWQQIQSYYDQANPGSYTMEQCRGFALPACQLFYPLTGEPGKVPGCAGWGNGSESWNPFRWPDPNLKVWPAP
jgi:hypothetical protein